MQQIVLVLIGGIITWFITHRYYEKSFRDQKNLLEKLSQELKEGNTLKYFELLLEKSKWKKEFIGHNEIWVAEENNTFQIYSEPQGEWRGHEEWTKTYPDQNATIYSVYLKINNTTIKELTFITLDGGRIFVPIPDRKFENGKASYFWNMNSLEIKVCKIIGYYYIHKNIYDVAKRSKIEIID
jgi:hypothetical protein